MRRSAPSKATSASSTLGVLLRNSLLLGALVLTLLALAGCCVSVAERPPATLPRPRMPALPELTIGAATLAREHGELVVTPLTDLDARAIEALAASEDAIYVIDAAALDEILVRRLQHLRDLHAAPWWEGPLPAELAPEEPDR